MTRVYYNPNTKKTAELDTAAAVIVYTDTENRKTRRAYRQELNAAADLRKHGYILICIR